MDIGYRVKITVKGFDEHHEAYFRDLPTAEQVLASIERDANLAGRGWEDLYSSFASLAVGFNWPTRWQALMAEVGSPAYMPGVDRLPSNAGGYVRIKRFRFEETE